MQIAGCQQRVETKEKVQVASWFLFLRQGREVHIRPEIHMIGMFTHDRKITHVFYARQEPEPEPVRGRVLSDFSLEVQVLCFLLSLHD